MYLHACSRARGTFSARPRRDDILKLQFFFSSFFFFFFPGDTILFVRAEVVGASFCVFIVDVAEDWLQVATFQQDRHEVAPILLTNGRRQILEGNAQPSRSFLRARTVFKRQTKRRFVTTSVRTLNKRLNIVLT